MTRSSKHLVRNFVNPVAGMSPSPLHVVACLALMFTKLATAADSNVIALDASNFDKFIENTPLVMVEFYA